MEHISFDPAPTTPCSTPQNPPRPVCQMLILQFSRWPQFSTGPQNAQNFQTDEEEDFQMVPLDDEHWSSEDNPLKGHYVFMNMVYHMDYAHTHALLQTIKYPPIWTDWI